MKELGKFNRFKPGTAPAWDDSYNDPPSIRHDCFTVERLFVVPWGSGEGEVGRLTGDAKTIYEPELYVGADGGIGLLTEVDQTIKVFDVQGKQTAQRTVNYLSDPYVTYEDCNIGVDELRKLGPANGSWSLGDGFAVGVVFSYHPTSDGSWTILATDEKTGQTRCKTYGPPTLDDAKASSWGIQPAPVKSRPRILPDGSIVVGMVRQTGYEVYQYRFETGR